MEKIANEQLESMAKFYKSMGVSSNEFMQGKNILSIFSYLGIKPEFDEIGNRKLTPYEILGVLPNIQNGREKPIVFFVKNKLKNIKPAKPNGTQIFVFPKDKNNEDKSLIDFVLASYKSAVAQNNLADAERQYEMLNKLTGGRANHYLKDFYDYTKFYRQMKKQLLIDIFSHFFLVYLMEQKSIIKKGLIIKNRKFKPFNVLKQSGKSADNMPQIKSVRLDDVSDEIVSSQKKIDDNKDNTFDDSIFKARTLIDTTKDDLKNKIEENQKKQLQAVEPKKASFIKKFKKHLYRKNKTKTTKKLTPKVQNNDAAFELKNKQEKEVVYE